MNLPPAIAHLSAQSSLIGALELIGIEAVQAAPNGGYFAGLA